MVIAWCLLRAEINPFQILALAALSILFLLLPGLFWRARMRVAGIYYDVEVSRDVAVPRSCASCGSTDAPFALPVRMFLTFFRKVSAVARLNDPRAKRRFDFHFCLSCARPIRRRRRHGQFVMVVGFLLFLPFILFVGLGSFPPFAAMHRVFMERYAIDGWQLMKWFLWQMGPGTVLVFVGFWMQLYSPAVLILDNDGEKIVFHFRSELCRDQFAHLNGE